MQLDLDPSIFSTFASFDNIESPALYAAQTADRFTYCCCEITIEELDLSFRGFHLWRHLTVLHLHLNSTTAVSNSQRPASGRTAVSTSTKERQC